MAEPAQDQFSPGDLRALTAWSTIAAQLMTAARRDDGFAALCSELTRLCRFQNFIVYMFREGEKPQLVETNLGLPWLKDRMAGYINGLYALDPFHRCTCEKQTGLFRMMDIMPEAFLHSEYFNYFYRFTNVHDELRYVIQAHSRLSVHVFVEREGTGNGFTTAEVQMFEALQPLVTAFVTTHVAWLEEKAGGGGSAANRFDLREKILEMQPGTLTPREIDTVELLLKGHSTKSMARVLQIDGGTVANHKRNLYAKLGIHSQAQLFDLFLRSLTGESER